MILGQTKGPKSLAPAGSTGSQTHAGTIAESNGSAVAFQFFVEVIGATPTVTFKYQGSLDGLTWTDVTYVSVTTDTLATATQTVTAVGTTVNFLQNSGVRNWNYFRLVTSANTNVTYSAEVWVQAGGLHD